MKKCPFCAEAIQEDAIVCRFCQRDLRSGQAPAVNVSLPNAIKVRQADWISSTARVGCATILGLVLLTFFVGLCSIPSGPAAPAPNARTEAKPNPALSATSAPRAPAASKWTGGPGGVSPMDGSPTVVYQLPAEDTFKAWLKTVHPSLVIRCKERRTDAYIVTQTAASVEASDLERHTVRLRFDEGPASTQSWSQSTDSEALFAPQGISFAKRIARTKTLRVEFTPFNASPALMTFDVRGFEQRLPAIAKACGWKP